MVSPEPGPQAEVLFKLLALRLTTSPTIKVKTERHRVSDERGLGHLGGVSMGAINLLFLTVELSVGNVCRVRANSLEKT